MTLIVFCMVLALNLASIAWLTTDESPAAYGAAAMAVILSLGSVWVSEERGFVRTRQMRRAFEPARHFNGFQILTLLALVMVQIGLTSYFLIT